MWLLGEVSLSWPVNFHLSLYFDLVHLFLLLGQLFNVRSAEDCHRFVLDRRLVLLRIWCSLVVSVPVRTHFVLCSQIAYRAVELIV